MRIYKSTKRVLVAVAICLVVAASLFVITTRGSRRFQTPQSPASQKQNDEATAVRDALRRGGLREAAKLKRNYVAEYDPHWDWGHFTVENLTKNSVAVLVGRITKKLDARLIEGKVIYTDYEVAVDELIKGNLAQAKTVVVTIPGGRVYFEDGTSAEQTTPTFEAPRVGRAYALFLMQEQAVPSVFFLSGGPQGLFDIEDAASVRSHGKPEDPGAVETKGKSKDAFLNDVRANARKWPKPGKCCG
jgi:hypothetical protein